ncbi:MAG: STAS domain-containing protein [Anaerolineales bacterium]
MSAPNVKLIVRKPDANVSVIDIAGEVNGFAENQLMDAYAEATSDGARAIVLNFVDLEYMNSSGIGLLVTMLIRVQRQQRRLLAYGLTDHYKEIFQLTRLNEAINIYGDEAEALAAVQ